MYNSLYNALKRPLKATTLTLGAASVMAMAAPQISVALWAAAPIYQLGVACLALAVGFALTYASEAVQLSAAGSVVGAALAVACSPGPLALRLVGGAMAGALGAQSASALFAHGRFVVLGLGVLAAVVAADRGAASGGGGGRGRGSEACRSQPTGR